MRRPFLLLFAAVLLLSSCSSSRSLRMMSFNIRNSSAWNHDGYNAWCYRRDAVVDMIRQEHPDAIGMQEVLPDQLHFLDSALAADYGRIGVGRDDGKLEGENMCIFYRRDRLQLVTWHTQWLSPTPSVVSFGWDAACRRTATVATFVDLRSHDTLTYINTHLDHMGQQARQNSVLQLVGICARFTHPVIIGGDMNSDITDPIFRPLDKAGLPSARDIATHSDTAYTFTGYGKCPLSTIDHFFVKGWRVLTFATLNGNYGVPYISDHYPVMMDIVKAKK